MNTARTIRAGKTEFYLSLAVLVILAAIGIGVYLRQFEFNPAVVALSPEFNQYLSPENTTERVLIDTTGTEIRPFSPMERFGPDTLYEKINGRADLYLASGFVSLQTQRFTVPNDADAWVEIFVYEMSSGEGAFSVFSTQRRGGDSIETNHANAYHTENAMFMALDKLYVEIIGTDSSDSGKQARKILSAKLLEKYSDKTETSLPGVELFPKKGFVADSLQIITANAFGHEKLDRIYTGDYLIDGSRFTAFVSIRETSDLAASLANDYRGALISYGATVVDSDTGIADAAVLKIFDTYEIIFSRRIYFAGIHEAKDLEKAVQLANLLFTRLEERNEK
jgi:hypothetical protein